MKVSGDARWRGGGWGGGGGQTETRQITDHSVNMTKQKEVQSIKVNRNANQRCSSQYYHIPSFGCELNKKKKVEPDSETRPLARSGFDPSEQRPSLPGLKKVAAIPGGPTDGEGPRKK